MSEESKRTIEYYYANREHYLAKRAEYAKSVREYIKQEKSKPCSDCGVEYPYYVMDFDHRDPSQKTGQISTHKSRGMKWVKKEIAKCDLVCANCHRERTHGQGADT